MASNFKNNSLALGLALIFGILFSSNGFSQSYSENALLWEITGNDLDQPSYVYAILKFIPEEKYYFPKNAEKAFASCGILATETSLDHHAKHELNKAAHLAHGKTLKDVMSEKDYVNLEELFIGKLGVTKLKFDLVYKKFKPIMLSTTITRLAMEGNIKYYEPELMIKAHESGMISMGLETVEREVMALESFSLEDQVTALNHTVNNIDKQLEDYNAVVNAFILGDLHKTLEYTLHPVENNEDFRQSFIVERNREWIPKIIEYMHMSPTFFAIGASHMADENGVLHLLEEAGYTIKPIK